MRQQRKPGGERRREIIDVAAEMFAARGFGVSTRAIASALGITQAALYKHFASKDELVEAVFNRKYLDEKPSNFAEVIQSGREPFVERLAHAYDAFFNQITETTLKLFQRASYDGLKIAKQYSPHLDERIIWPVLNALRAETKLPNLDRIAPLREERELVLMLHSTIVFLAMRKFVYRIDFKGTETRIIEQHVNTWFVGALVTMRRLHDDDRANETSGETSI